MTTTLEAANEAPAAAPAQIERVCVECGEKFTPPAKGPGQHKKFCKDKCRNDFGNREKAQGALIVTLAKVHHMHRHAPAGSVEAGIAGDCRTEMQRILRLLISEDEKDGRAARLPCYVKGLLNVDNCYQDRRRRKAA